MTIVCSLEKPFSYKARNSLVRTSLTM